MVADQRPPPNGSSQRLTLGPLALARIRTTRTCPAAFTIHSNPPSTPYGRALDGTTNASAPRRKRVPP
ncbi:hypothetical protein FRC12_020410, partial [Ceratobasidium sp. 428]